MGLGERLTTRLLNDLLFTATTSVLSDGDGDDVGVEETEDTVVLLASAAAADEAEAEADREVDQDCATLDAMARGSTAGVRELAGALVLVDDED